MARADLVPSVDQPQQIDSCKPQTADKHPVVEQAKTTRMKTCIRMLRPHRRKWVLVIPSRVRPSKSYFILRWSRETTYANSYVLLLFAVLNVYPLAVLLVDKLKPFYGWIQTEYTALDALAVSLAVPPHHSDCTAYYVSETLSYCITAEYAQSISNRAIYFGREPPPPHRNTNRQHLFPQSYFAWGLTILALLSFWPSLVTPPPLPPTPDKIFVKADELIATSMTFTYHRSPTLYWSEVCRNCWRLNFVLMPDAVIWAMIGSCGRSREPHSESLFLTIIYPRLALVRF